MKPSSAANPMPAALPEVLHVLLKRQAPGAERLALTSRHLLIEVGRALLGRQHPVDFLAQPAAQQPFHRLCIRCCLWTAPRSDI